MKLIIAFGAAIVVFTILVIVDAIEEGRRRRARMREVFADRPSLSDEQFFELYFEDLRVSKETVIGVKKVLEEVLDADLSQMLPTDCFSNNIRFFFEFDSMADVELVIALENEFGIEITDAEAKSLRTIQDIVLLVDKKRVSRKP